MRRYELMRPFSLLEGFDKDFDKLFYPESGASKWKPLSRVKEEENHYHLALDIPGVDKENLKVELHDQVLSISGERSDHMSKENQDFKSFMSFEQSFSLPKDANLDEIEVNQNNGVLDVVIPKQRKEDAKRSLEVKDGQSSFLGRILR